MLKKWALCLANVVVFLSPVAAGWAAEPCTDAPRIAIVSPPAGATFSGGETIEFFGTAEDHAGGLPAGAYTWAVDLHTDSGVRPFLAPAVGVVSGTFTVPRQFETASNIFLRVHLTVADACGALHHETRDIQPRRSRLTIDTDPPALLVTLDGETLRAPVTLIGVAGVLRRIGLPAGAQTFAGAAHELQAWSDGGGYTHEIETPEADTTLTATLRPVSPSNCTASPAAGGFRNRALGFSGLLGPLTVELAARPSASPINAVVGLSRGARTALNGFAALVRFNPDGFIDARNGDAYAAANAIPYAAGATYNFRLVLNVLTHRYSIFVRRDGASTEQVVGRDFAFRDEQSGVAQLDNLGVWASDRPTGVVRVCRSTVVAPSCFAVTSQSALSEEFQDTRETESQAGVFDAEFDATPAESPTNSVIALSQDGGLQYADFACLVRFNPAGRIDARNGDAYQAASNIPFAAGVTYHFRFAVDVPAHRYSVFVRPSDGATERVVGQDFAFRTEQNAVSTLAWWNARVADEGDKTTVCTLDVSARPTCEITLGSSSETFGAVGGTAALDVAVSSGTPRGPADCRWTATSASSFITVVHGADGRGNGSFSYTVSPNSGGTRRGTITVGDRTFTVTQQAER
jgi:hypothetical protein